MKGQFRLMTRSKTMKSVINNDPYNMLNSPRDLNSSILQHAEIQRLCDILQIQRQKDKATKQQQKRQHIKNLLAKKFRLIYNVIRLLHHHERVILEKHDEQLKKKQPFLLYPGDTTKKIWNTVLMITYIQTAFYLPLRISFLDEKTEGVFYIDVLDDIIYCILLRYLIVLDIVISLRSCYFNRQNVLISNQWSIFLNYLKGWLLFDVIAIIPLQYIFQITIQYNKFSRFVRVFRINQIIKVSTIQENNDFVIRSWGKIFNVLNSYQINILRVVIRFIYGLHLFSCLWHFASNASIGNFTEDDFNHQDSQYITSIFWALQTFSTIGYGNDPAKNYAQYIIAILWMLLGASFYCVVLLNLSEWLKKLNTECAYEEIQSNLQQFFKKIEVIKEVKEKIQQYLSLNIKSNQAWSLSLQEWFKDLPILTQKEITLFVSYIEMMHIHFFRLNLNFSVSILPKMMLMKTQQYSKIWIKEESVNEIFFLIRGKLQYRTQFGKVLLQVSEGQIFGEQEYFKKFSYSKQPFRKYYAVAIESCEYIVLNAEYFFNQIVHYPGLCNYLAIIADNREQEMKAQMIDNYFQREREIISNIKLEQIKETCNIDVIRYKGMMKPKKSIIYETQHSRTQQILDQLIHNKKNRIEKLMNKFRKVAQMIIFANNLLEKQQQHISKIHPMLQLHQQQQQTQTTLKTTSNESRIFINSGISKITNSQNIKKIQKSIIIKMKQFSNQSFRKRRSLFSKKIWVHKFESKEILQQIFRLKESKNSFQYSFQDSILEVQDFSHYEQQLSIFRNNFQVLKQLKKVIKQHKENLKQSVLELEEELENVSMQIGKLELTM